MHAFEFLAQPDSTLSSGLWVIYGDDRFLKQMVLREFESRVLGPDSDLGAQRLEAGQVQWSDVADALSSASLFGPAVSFVILEDADKFVSEHRKRLEQWAQRHPPRSTLLLVVDSWPGNTTLAKSVSAAQQGIDGGLPRKSGKSRPLDTAQIVRWIQQRAEQQHELQVPREAASYLLEQGEPELGLYEQYLAKLALLVPPQQPVTRQKIDELIGGWRKKTAFEMLDAALDGDAPSALLQLERLLQAGEAPQAIFGAVAFTLRRFATATQLVEQQEQQGQRVDLRQAVAAAGFWNWQADPAVVRLKRLGRPRCRQMFERLLQLDLALKGTHSQPHRARWAFEEIIVWLARPAARSPART